MEKKTIRQWVGKDISYDACSDAEATPIDDVIASLVSAKRQGATHIDWNARTDSDGCSDEVKLQPILFRMESDAEFHERKKWAEREAAERAKVDRARYEELKKKFEP